MIHHLAMSPQIWSCHVPGCHWPSHISSTRFPSRNHSCPKAAPARGLPRTSSSPDRNGLESQGPGLQARRRRSTASGTVAHGHASCPRHLLYCPFFLALVQWGQKTCLDGMSCLWVNVVSPSQNFKICVWRSENTFTVTWCNPGAIRQTKVTFEQIDLFFQKHRGSR